MRHVIAKIEKNSIAEELSLEIGDCLLSINGLPVTDILDYMFLLADEYIEIEIEKKSGERWVLEIDKEFDEMLGVSFENPILDDAKSCSNKCIFCFVDQMPVGMRKTLYFKDDDSRLSFLQGNFVTLTNVNEMQLERIIRYHISPINVSVHTTDPELRAKMLNNRFAGDIYERVKRLTDAGIVVNAQIVLCPGYNDGENLRKTLKDLSALSEHMESIAIVPVGLSKFREGLAEIAPVTREVARETISIIGEVQEECLASRGTRFAYASDEFYLKAEYPMPDEDFYEGYIQLENGVGLMRKFENDLEEALSVNKVKHCERTLTIATGKAAESFMRKMAEKVMSQVEGLTINVVGIVNDYFGHQITVAGLVTATDLINQLSEVEIGDGLILPDVMFKSDESIFLDDLTEDDVNNKLETNILKVPVQGEGFLKTVLNIE